MAKAQPSIAARFDPDPNHYILTEVEFERLCEVARIPEKENAFFLGGLFLPCAITVFSAIPADMSKMTVGYFFNALVALVTALVILMQGRAWYSKRKLFKNYVDGIKNRPEGRVAVTAASSSVFVAKTEAG